KWLHLAQISATRIDLDVSRRNSLERAVALPAKSTEVICSGDDEYRGSRELSRFFSRETAHHCAFVVASAGRAESPVHQCWHEPVRADLSRSAKANLASAAPG